MAKKIGILKKFIFGIVGAVVLFILILIMNLIILEKNESIVSKGQPIENFREQHAALLVIDVQEVTTGDVSTYSFYKKYSDNLIRNINQITGNFRSHNLPVIYVRSEISNPFVNLLNNSYAKGSTGAKFDKRLETASGIIVVKNRSDSFRNTDLDKILNNNKISELYIVGLDAAECINSTVKAAQYRNYRVNLIDEAILSKSIQMKDSMMVNFKDRGVKIISMNSLNIVE